MKSKTCPNCNRRKLIILFGVNRRTGDGRNVYCKLCVRKLSSESYQRTIKKARARRKKYYWDNQKRMKRYHAMWYLRNKSKRKKQVMDYRNINSERVKKYQRRWTKENPLLCRARERRYRKSHPEVGKQHCHKRKAMMRDARVERVDYRNIIIRDKSICHICAKKIPKPKMSFDHIVPLSKGGAHSYNNIACAHLRCNLEKGSRIDVVSLKPIQV